VLRTWAIIVGLLWVCASAEAAPILTTPYVLVSDYQFGRIQRFTPQGQFIDTFAINLGNAGEMAVGPDGNLYVSDFEHDRITKLNGQTGSVIGLFVNGGTLDSPRGIAFGPDGNLYVAKANSGAGQGAVQKYNGITGAFMGNFATGSNVDGSVALSFGPNGDLYVGLDTRFTMSPRADAVKRFNGTTGAFVQVVATTGVDIPQDIFFRARWKDVRHQSGAAQRHALSGHQLPRCVRNRRQSPGDCDVPRWQFLFRQRRQHGSPARSEQRRVPGQLYQHQHELLIGRAIRAGI
jgi:hypothetical protein